MRFVYDDGGRAAAGFRGETRDCVVRAICIITGEPYATVYAHVNGYGRRESPRVGKASSARRGVRKATTRQILADYGFDWHPTMSIGSGCRVHLRDDELPSGRLIVSCSRHVVAVIDGAIHDTYDPSRCGTRCVYGYWTWGQ